ncbi:nuclear transport factor 2 family protein [Mycobacterium sp. URHB0044]|jgi:hypothetical protein|uniref:nuclear transport factor 2 family protein n=1 Tax=Mycobacterium sp. URHB0044 TaxID=1380386 RepID=UPI00048F3071|nr:nuclear transport factor 2 family protein [Mycobacterium sp. URHB0044]
MRRLPTALGKTTATLALTLALPVTVATIATPATSWADTCAETGAGVPLAIDAPPCADVLAQEARWLTAITSGDRETVEDILSPTFRHVNADGQMFDRAQEIAATEPLPLVFNASDQIVDIAGDTAVIHGINTLTQDGKVLDRERFIDVFVLQNGVWLALAAQETVI